MDDKDFHEELLQRLNTIICLLLDLPSSETRGNVTEMAVRLSEMGLNTGEIASIVGKASKDISTTLRRSKKPKKKEK